MNLSKKLDIKEKLLAIDCQFLINDILKIEEEKQNEAILKVVTPHMNLLHNIQDILNQYIKNSRKRLLINNKETRTMEKKTISIKWHILDVLCIAEKRGIQMSEEQAYKILLDIKRTHDASIGVSWDVIEAHLDFFESEEK